MIILVKKKLKMNCFSKIISMQMKAILVVRKYIKILLIYLKYNIIFNFSYYF